MKTDQKSTSFARWAHPWEYRLAAVVLLGLYGFILWADARRKESDGLVLGILLGIPVLFCVCFLLVPSFVRITVSPEGVRVSIGRFTLRQVAAGDIRTVVKSFVPGGRGRPLIKLVISPVPVREMEADGERRLRKKAFVRDELKFREGRSDWGDLCLGARFGRWGCIWKNTFWIEFTPERQQLLRELFPDAAHREAKRYNDPPSLV